MKTDDADDGTAEKLTERPWIHLASAHDVESWINNYDWELRRHAAQAGAAEAAIGFRLAHGGEIILQTMPEGSIRLEVTPEAEWAAPVISAATGLDAPPGAAIWDLPSDVLTQLVLGLSSLIVSVRPVTVTRKKQRITW
jgi:hypothetical protein